MIDQHGVSLSEQHTTGLLLCHGTQQNLSLSTVKLALYAKLDKAAMKFSPALASITFAISPSLSPPRRGLVHTVYVCTNYPRFIWIHKITYTYHALGMNVNRAFCFTQRKWLLLQAICCFLWLYHMLFLLWRLTVFKMGPCTASHEWRRKVFLQIDWLRCWL